MYWTPVRVPIAKRKHYHELYFWFRFTTTSPLKQKLFIEKQDIILDYTKRLFIIVKLTLFNVVLDM